MSENAPSDTRPAACLTAFYRAVDRLVAYGREKLGLAAADEDWARNRVLALFGLDSYAPGSKPVEAPATPSQVLEPLDAAAEAAGLYGPQEAARYDDVYMSLMEARPSTLQAAFIRLERSKGPMAAMDWFYAYCCAADYVKKERLDRNIRFISHGLVVTINLAKPEFATQQKANAGNALSGGYPLCTICHENEGFAGRDKRTLRTIPVTLDGAPWFWQFSPYGYFHEHGICVNRQHTPMHIDRSTFVRLLDFVDRFPGYFLGCNAALPRIGGSVLAHDHYQGGGEILPMLKAPALAKLRLPGQEEAVLEVLDWPGTAVRVVSHSRHAIVEVSERIRRAWVSFDDPKHDIRCTDSEGHAQSSLSPSVIRTSRGYEMNLIFRNNAVSHQYPEGIFHAHPQYFAIKHEPIGLIEAQGLFILPGRLIRQLKQLEEALVAGNPLPKDLAAFRPQWEELASSLGPGDHAMRTVQAAVRDELGSVCFRILGNTAVFRKKSETLDFLERIGFERL